MGWFSKIIPPTKILSPRGWHLYPHRLLDIWGRWDTDWYISIIEHGRLQQFQIWQFHRDDILIWSRFAPQLPYFCRCCGLTNVKGLHIGNCWAGFPKRRNLVSWCLGELR